MCEVCDPCPLPAAAAAEADTLAQEQHCLLLSLKRARGGTPRGLPRGLGDDHGGRGGSWKEARTRDRLGHRPREKLNAAEGPRPSPHV